jgi:acyl-CoA dehydrogenase
MNDELRLLRETLEEALLALHPPTSEALEHGDLSARTWETAVELGWDQVGLPEDLGGFGDSIGPLSALAQAAGRHRVSAPLVESALARWTIAAAGLAQPPDGVMLTIHPGAGGGELNLHGDQVQGRAARVPWARHADLVVVTGLHGTTAVLDLRGVGVQIVNGSNLAGEARDSVLFAGVVAEAFAEAGDQPRFAPERAALLRAAQMLGAMDQALAATREHTAARKQFGQPLDRFQLVGAHIATMAAETTQVEAMLADAIRAHDAGAPVAATASLKLVAGQAATRVARAAHQCHGAIGVTREYRLHQFSRRLWAWRDELGSERSASRTLGAAALTSDRDELWAISEPQPPVPA